MKRKPIRERWTFGVEHELSDWFLSDPLPKGITHNTKDYTIVNSDGIANDPSGKIWRYGGELNTAPTDDAEGQAEILLDFLRLHPNASVNYRSNLHVHVRVPGLRDDLPKLKQIQGYNRRNLTAILPLVDPMPSGAPPYSIWAVPMWQKRYKRRKVSHHHQLNAQQYDAQQRARTVEEFFEAEVPHRKNGTPCWHLGTRCAVNMRQLMETDTIEFRHFVGTLDATKLTRCIEWCRLYLEAALTNHATRADLIYDRHFDKHAFPRTPLLDPVLETGYRMTCHDGSLKDAEIRANIDKIKNGYLEGLRPNAKNGTRAKARARNMSR